MTRPAILPNETPFDAALAEQRLQDASPERVLEFMIGVFGQKIAAVSSFGAESAVLLSMVAEIEPSTPVLFLDTGYLFQETLDYRDELTARLRLTNVQTILPDAEKLSKHDPENALWADNPDACCHLRKVAPLAKALQPFDAWINGRKRYHGMQRAGLQIFEMDGERIKVNPLARMTREDINTRFALRQLPRHPLEALGFYSIGCMPCTSRSNAAEGLRSGRWRGTGKTECGIHSSLSPVLNMAKPGH